MILYAEEKKIVIPDVSGVILRAFDRWEHVIHHDYEEDDYQGSYLQAFIGGSWIDLQYYPSEEDAENALVCVLHAFATGRQHFTLERDIECKEWQ